MLKLLDCRHIDISIKPVVHLLSLMMETMGAGLGPVPLAAQWEGRISQFISNLNADMHVPHLLGLGARTTRLSTLPQTAVKEKLLY